MQIKDVTCLFKQLLTSDLVFSLELEIFAHMLFFLSFCSGVIGSGLAIFSKYRIHDTFLYRYSLNGYPYMVSLENRMERWWLSIVLLNVE